MNDFLNSVVLMVQSLPSWAVIVISTIATLVALIGTPTPAQARACSSHFADAAFSWSFFALLTLGLLAFTRYTSVPASWLVFGSFVAGYAAIGLAFLTTELAFLVRGLRDALLRSRREFLTLVRTCEADSNFAAVLQAEARTHGLDSFKKWEDVQLQCAYLNEAEQFPHDINTLYLAKQGPHLKSHIETSMGLELKIEEFGNVNPVERGRRHLKITGGTFKGPVLGTIFFMWPVYLVRRAGALALDLSKSFGALARIPSQYLIKRFALKNLI